MIDIHSHILPGVDDGAKNFEVSIEMARMYIENGIEKVIATPHYIGGINNKTLDENREILNKLTGKIKEENLDLEVVLGNEIMISLEILRDIGKGKVTTLNGTRYVLVELPMFDIPLYTEDMIYELLLKGYIPVIAHPERNSKIMEDPNILFNYISNGALAQLNLPSLEGRYGSEVREVSEILLKHNMIHFIGTDSHGVKKRSPRVGNSLEVLQGIVSQKGFQDLVYKNPQFLWNNKDIEIKSPIKYEKKNIFRGFIEGIRIFNREAGV